MSSSACTEADLRSTRSRVQPSVHANDGNARPKNLDRLHRAQPGTEASVLVTALRAVGDGDRGQAPLSRAPSRSLGPKRSVGAVRGDCVSEG
jgi:hypothetical protein